MLKLEAFACQIYAFLMHIIQPNLMHRNSFSSQVEVKKSFTLMPVHQGWHIELRPCI
jgi:hypothetical protein